MKQIDCYELYDDPMAYDLLFHDTGEDLPFYLKLIRKYGDPVLEIACGTGRITIAIAREKIDISGLDVSERMLDFAKHKAIKEDLTVEFINADCRNFELNRKYRFIFIPFNSITHLHDLDSIESFFRSIRKHMEFDGVFVIDFFLPDMNYLMRDPLKRYPVGEYIDPGSCQKITVTETNEYDNASQINRIKWYYYHEKDGVEIVKENNMRIFFPQELDSLLIHNGFRITDKFGNYDESPICSDSKKQLIICGLS